MAIHTLQLDDEELLVLRDAVATEASAQRLHVRRQGEKATERAKQRLAVLEGLSAELKERCGMLR